MIALPSWLNKPSRVRLEQKDFLTLVSGGEVVRDGVKIILADIGWRAMLASIGEAMGKRRLVCHIDPPEAAISGTEGL